MRNRSRREIACIYGILIVAVCFALFPIVWGLSTSLKDAARATAYPPKLIPHPVYIANYLSLFTKSHMPRYLVNSTVVSLSTVICTILIASHSGYATARFRFPGRKIVLFLLLSTAMIPGISILAPLYSLSIRLGIHDTYFVLVFVYSAWQVATATWIMKGFFETIPRGLEEAAKIDGCSTLGAFYRIIFPLSQPGLAAVGILVFIYVWNDFVFQYTLTISDEMTLIQRGLQNYITAFGVEWGLLMAALMVALLPVIGLFIFLQSRFVEGLTSGAAKG
jgi:ABC-type glycerol-3-phosphate transport system permease component